MAHLVIGRALELLGAGLVDDMGDSLLGELATEAFVPDVATATSRSFDRLENRSINSGATPSISNAELRADGCEYPSWCSRLASSLR